MRDKPRHYLILPAIVLAAGMLLSCGVDAPTTSTPPAPRTPSSSSGNAPAMNAPARIDMSPQGNLIVSDHSTGGVYVFNGTSAEGAFGFLAGNGSPLAVAAGDEGIFVGSKDAGNIDLWSYDGSFDHRVIEPGIIGRPSDMALDENIGALFVLDAKDKQVKFFNTAGTFISAFPAPDAPAAQSIIYPTGIALDTIAKLVYVSDFRTLNKSGGFSGKVDAQIQVYDYFGSYIKTIPSTSGSAYGFSRPQGLAVVPNAYVLVAESAQGKVHMFNTTTSAGVKTLGSLGSGDGELFLPLDVWIDTTTYDVYVTDNRNGRITVFNGGGLVP